LLKVQIANYLGIYLAKDHATVVCLAAQGRERNMVGCFSVSAEKPEEPSFQDIARRIAAVCAERQIKFVEASVALDCAMFMQHSIHSEFSDPRKIAQTVRFDTEEALGTDATDVAISFRINSAEKAGAELSAFTAKKTLLSDLLGALQSNNLDPVSVEPDVNCLARFVCQNVSLAPNAHPLFVFLSRRNGYFVSPAASPWQGISPTPATSLRTFLLSASQNRTNALTKQVSMTTALLQSAAAVNQLEILDAADSINYDEIGEKLSIAANRIDLTGMAKVPPENLADCPDTAEFAIAYGAALVHLDLPASTNFRSDFMPYQGRRMRLQKTLKFSSVAAVVLMFALGLYGLMQAIQINRYRTQLRAKYSKEYSAVMFGEKVQGKLKNSTDKLARALRRVKEAQKGFSLTGEQAVSAKLALVLQAFNKCAAVTGLNVESVAITDKAITISGESPSPENSLRVFDALRQAGFNILQQRISTDAGKSSFSVTTEPKQQAGGSQ
jgi:hypothetical protein